MSASGLASKVTQGLGKVVEKTTGGSAGTGDDSEDDSELAAEMAKKYLLRVSAGPSYDVSTHKPVFVNSGISTSFENEWVHAKVRMRIRGYQGLPKGSKEDTPYFHTDAHSKDQYSISFSIVPKQDFAAVDTIWGNDFDRPVRDRLPPAFIFNAAWKIFNTVIDPGCTCDAYCDEPWLFGPSLSTIFCMRIGEKLPEEQWANHPHPEEDDPLVEGGDGSGEEIREKLGIPANSSKRRKHFLKEANRAEFTFEKGRLYTFDFFNPYLDFNNFKVRLPGFSISVARYINDKTHTLRYVFKNGKTNDVYLVTQFTLLYGPDMEEGIKLDNERVAREAQPQNQSQGQNQGQNQVHPHTGYQESIVSKYSEASEASSVPQQHTQ